MHSRPDPHLAFFVFFEPSSPLFPTAHPLPILYGTMPPLARTLLLTAAVALLAASPAFARDYAPDAARGGTADLCDVHCPDPVDVVVGAPQVQIAAPVFR